MKTYVLLPSCAYAFVWTQAAVSTDVEATAGAVQREDKEHDALLQDPMLDNMLLRMEEIEVRTFLFLLLPNILILYLYLNI